MIDSAKVFLCEGKLFMSEREFNIYAAKTGFEHVAMLVLDSCNTADAAIRKMMGK